jgi:hypothetical protein
LLSVADSSGSPWAGDGHLSRDHSGGACNHLGSSVHS